MQHGPEPNYGTSTQPATDPIYYLTPAGETWRLHSVALVDGHFVKSNMRHGIHATHRAFVNEHGDRRYAAFTNIDSRGTNPRTLFEQLAAAVPREQL